MSSAQSPWQWDPNRQLYFIYLKEERTYVFSNGERVRYDPQGGVAEMSQPATQQRVATDPTAPRYSDVSASITTTTPTNEVERRDAAYVYSTGRTAPQPSVSPQQGLPYGYQPPATVQPQTYRDTYGHDPRRSGGEIGSSGRPTSVRTYDPNYGQTPASGYTGHSQTSQYATKYDQRGSSQQQSGYGATYDPRSGSYSQQQPSSTYGQTAAYSGQGSSGYYHPSSSKSSQQDSKPRSTRMDSDLEDESGRTVRPGKHGRRDRDRSRSKEHRRRHGGY